MTVGRAGEGPDWRGFCAAVTPRFSASSPELAGGGRRQPAIRMFSERWQRTRLARSGQRNRFFFCLFLPAGGPGIARVFLGHGPEQTSLRKPEGLPQARVSLYFCALFLIKRPHISQEVCLLFFDGQIFFLINKGCHGDKVVFGKSCYWQQ